MAILQQPRTLDMMGLLNAICPLVSFFIAFLPSFLYASSRGPRKVAIFLGTWYAFVFWLARFPLLADESTFEAPADLAGFALFASTPFVGILMFYFGLYRVDPKVQKFMHSWPASWTCAQQLFRFGGACFLFLYGKKASGYDSYFNLQTGTLDCFMGLTAVPMAIYVHKSNGNIEKVKSLLLLWHGIGLYDLAFAFTAAAAHYFGFYRFKHSLGFACFPPVTLICYYQVAWAIGIHTLYLTKIDTILEAQNLKKKMA